MKLFLVGRSSYGTILDEEDFVLARSHAEARKLYRDRVYASGRLVPQDIKACELPFDHPRILDTFEEGWNLTRTQIQKEQGVNDQQVAWWAT